jgi:dynein heavy chain
VPSLIKSALTLHQQICGTFRKTAINFHYEFNLRHISGVFQGLLMAQPTQFQEAAKIVQLWIHESERVYGDRLVTPENLVQYKSMMFEQLKKSFSKFNFQRYFQNNQPENLIFCNFVNGI